VGLISRGDSERSGPLRCPLRTRLQGADEDHVQFRSWPMSPVPRTRPVLVGTGEPGHSDEGSAARSQLA
jgi:hypothetical protein